MGTHDEGSLPDGPGGFVGVGVGNRADEGGKGGDSEAGPGNMGRQPAVTAPARNL